MLFKHTIHDLAHTDFSEQERGAPSSVFAAYLKPKRVKLFWCSSESSPAVLRGSAPTSLFYLFIASSACVLACGLLGTESFY